MKQLASQAGKLWPKVTTEGIKGKMASVWSAYICESCGVGATVANHPRQDGLAQLDKLCCLRCGGDEIVILEESVGRDGKDD